jgi:hypothetical protein
MGHQSDVREIRCKDLDTIHVSQNRDQWWVLENTTTDITAPYNAANFFIM